MAIEKRKIICGLEYRYTTKCFTVMTCDQFLEDGKEVGKTNEHGCGYMPNMVSELKSLFNPSVDIEELAFIDAKWTPEVINSYKEYVEKLQEEFNKNVME